MKRPIRFSIQATLFFSILFGMIAALVLFFFYRKEKEDVFQQGRLLTETLFTSSRSQVESWYTDEMEDAGLIVRNRFFATILEYYLQKNVSDQDFIDYLNLVKSQHGYADIVFLSLKGDYASTNPALAYEDSVENGYLSAGNGGERCLFVCFYTVPQQIASGLLT
jgi:hypothetical protein